MGNKYLELLNTIVDKKQNDEPIDPNSRILIVDGTNTFIRSVSVNTYIDDNGNPVGGIVGFLYSIGFAIRTYDPTKVIIVFDGKGGSQKRRGLYKEYKENRVAKRKLKEETEDTLNTTWQLLTLMDFLEDLPLSIVCVDNVEADDVIAYATKQLNPNSGICIMSTDKDFLQLVDDRITIWSPTKKKTYNREEIQREFNVLPENFIYYKVLLGDKSDNIPGISGIGTKTIEKKFKFLNEILIESPESFIFNIKSLDDKKLIEKIDETIIKRNYQLMQLEDVDISGQTKQRIIDILRLQETKRLESQSLMIRLIKNKINIKNLETFLRTSFFSLDQINYNVKRGLQKL
ncbi:MAG: hypothetical protein M0R17_09200 [Candidatus Omnitrophica bacterium]|jgi:5'-3' exonuclease|nr:hypothetical protein [Candidatus Omnitrophota bacterium]